VDARPSCASFPLTNSKRCPLNALLCATHQVLTESEVHIRGLEGTVQRLEEQVVSHTPAQAEIRASGVGELAYKRLVERQLDEARRDIEARDKTIEHFQRKSDALNDENARLRYVCLA